MKKFYLLGSLLLAGLTFTACSDDDNNMAAIDSNLDPSELNGTYDIVAVNTEMATDYDMDGTAHINQMEETECYDTASITFSGLHDQFTYQRHRLAVAEEQGIGLCDDLTITGTFVRIDGGYTNGTFRLTYVNGSGNTMTMDFVKEGTKLTQTNPYGPYPNRTANGTPTTTPGKIEYVFQKVSEQQLDQ
jgi:hypothetical protein